METFGLVHCSGGEFRHCTLFGASPNFQELGDEVPKAWLACLDMSAVSEAATGLNARQPQIASGYPHRNSYFRNWR
jgi:hypothetical protein